MGLLLQKRLSTTFTRLGPPNQISLSSCPTASKFSWRIFCHKQSVCMSLLDQDNFRPAQNFSMSGIFRPPLSNGSVASHLFILSGLFFHRNEKDKDIRFFITSVSIWGQTRTTWLNFERAIDFITVMRPIGVRCLYSQLVYSFLISSSLFSKLASMLAKSESKSIPNNLN